MGAILCVSIHCGLGSPARAQTPSDSSHTAVEPNIEAKIIQLETVKRGLARQARETNGYQESLRQMKIIKIDKLIARLKRGENVPQSTIDRTIGHSSLPLYKPPAS